MQKIIDAVADIVRAKFSAENSGHDWGHIDRVWQMTKKIAASERAAPHVSQTAEVAALLHDIADWKFHDGDCAIGPKEATTILENLSAPRPLIDEVAEIISSLSFKGAGVATPMSTHAGKIVQDADRLDAIGAIGIARCFAYGGFAGNPLYEPSAKVEHHTSAEAYRNNKSGSLNHFHEKLYLLKDRMNTPYARSLAHERHEFMHAFEERFLDECKGIV